jgi:hypothetical protein
VPGVHRSRFDRVLVVHRQLGRRRQPGADRGRGGRGHAGCQHRAGTGGCGACRQPLWNGELLPSTPYHCYLSNFVEFGLGPYPLGFVHVEENNNLNGRQSQNGAASLVLRNQPGDAAIRQAWKFHCAVARPSGPRRSCGDVTDAIAAFNRVRKTAAQNFLFQIGRFGWSTNTDFYSEYKPGPNPPNQPLGYQVEKVYNYPVICYYAGKRSRPIKRCSYAEFGEQNPILPPGA